MARRHVSQARWKGGPWLTHWYEITTEGKPIMSTFAEQSFLVSLTINMWGAKKTDKAVSKKVAKDHNADEDSGNYQKHLVPKSALEAITKAKDALRDFHYENTLPWLDDGVRCMPSTNYESYRTAIIGLQDSFDSAVREFAREWPAHVENARRALGDLFNERDYPSDVAARFGCKLRFMPIGDAEDFRVNISDAERELLREEMAGTLAEAERKAMGDIYRRLSDAVKAMAERLRAYKRDESTGKTSGVFRDSLVENLRELVELVPRLNFAGDPELEAVRKLVESELCEADAEELREDAGTRDRVAGSAEEIAARLGEFMGAEATPAA